MQFTAEMIAGMLNGEIVGDKNAAVSTVSSIDGGKAGSLAYLTNPKYEQYIYTTEASIVLVDKTFEPKEEVKTTLVKVENVAECVLNLLEMYNATRPRKSGISKLASIHEGAKVGDNCFIGCNTNLIAPVKLGTGVYTAAGSTITKDVPDYALAVERGQLKVREGYSLRKLKDRLFSGDKEKK